MKKLFNLTLTAGLFLSLNSLADNFNYNVEGMTCSGCVKIIKSKVCKLEGIDTCEVQIGSLKVTTKPGSKITDEQIKAAVAQAGDYSLSPATPSKEETPKDKK